MFFPEILCKIDKIIFLSESESDLDEPFKNYNDTIAIAKLKNCNQKLEDKCEHEYANI